MTGPVVEARHAEAVAALCWLVDSVAQAIDLDKAGPADALFGKGLLTAIGFLSLDPQSGSRSNTWTLYSHGLAVVEAWARRGGVS